MRIPAVMLRDYPAPANFQSLTEAELIPVRNAIVKFSAELGGEIAQALNPK